MEDNRPGSGYRRRAQLKIRIKADRGSEFPCLVCGRMCKAHDFQEKTWRHLNFFQHHCYITASVPRTNCPEHGVKMVKVPWAHKGTRFTMLFEQAAMVLVREMPVAAASRIMGINDKRLWRIVFHYVNKAMSRLDLSQVQGIGIDETSSGKGHRYVTIFIDLDRKDRPVLFVTEGKGRETIEAFKKYLESHNGKPENIARVVCDMFRAFISGSKEMLRWINRAEWYQGAKWRLSHFLNYANSLLDENPILKPVFKALETLKRHKDRILNVGAMITQMPVWRA